MLKITEAYFAEGIEELKLFFTRFKPTGDQIAAWYSRLNSFSSDVFQLAIYRMTEQDTGPSYETLKKELFKARHDLEKRALDIPEAQGYAPWSDQYQSFSKDFCALLYKIYAQRKKNEITKQQKDAQLKDLSEMYVSAYQNLPGYKNTDQIQKMIDRKEWSDLIKIGFLHTAPAEQKEVFVREFSKKFRPTNQRGF